MPLRISQSDIDRLHNSASKQIARARSVMEQAQGAIDQFVRTSEISVVSFGLGVVQGRYGGVEVVGVPVDLGAGVILHTLGFFGVAGAYGSHLHAAADGCLASFFTTLGRGVGTQMAESAKKGKEEDKAKELGEGAKKAALGPGAKTGDDAIPAAGFTDREIAALARKSA